MQSIKFIAHKGFATVALAIALSAPTALALTAGETESAVASVEPQGGACSVICPLPGEAPTAAQPVTEKTSHVDFEHDLELPGLNLTAIDLQ